MNGPLRDPRRDPATGDVLRGPCEREVVMVNGGYVTHRNPRTRRCWSCTLRSWRLTVRRWLVLYRADHGPAWKVPF
jgi:hypothetical protein